MSNGYHLAKDRVRSLKSTPEAKLLKFQVHPHADVAYPSSPHNLPDMTHRSRIGGPPKSHKRGSTAAPVRQRKLHHPPAARDEPETPEPVSAHLECPTGILDYPSDKQVLDLIYAALRSTISSPDFVPTIQRIKALLYDEKWLEVFEDEELLPAYAGRWVPSRALCFRELMGALEPVRGLFESGQKEEREDGQGQQEGEEAEVARDEAASEDDGELHVLSLGGGAGSELVALAALLRGIAEDGSSTPSKVKWTGVDIGSWAGVLDTLGSSVDSTWKGSLSRHYTKTDLLDSASPSTIQLFADLASSPPQLTTLFFTLTELLSQSPQRTIALLSRLTACIPIGGLILVVDSASDISSFSLGAGGREWPTYTMIDLIMLRLLAADDGEDGEKGENKGKWEKVESSDSRWFRLQPGTGADWPVKLENARYWFRLYRRI